MMDKDIMELAKYIPEQAAIELLPALKKHNAVLTITNARKTKFGDYKWPNKTYGYHRISVNGNLNQYAFLTTLLHEIAHMHTWCKYHNGVKIHGKEWKNAFSTLLLNFSQKAYLPKDIRLAFARHAQSPKASSMSDLIFFKTLSSYDIKNNAGTTHLSNLKVGNQFIHDQKKFRILEFKRSRILCENLLSKRKYLVHSLAEVYPV